MKNIYLIGGPMGVGKTTVSKQLTKKLDNCVFLDGDWCWASIPFLVTDETRKVVIDNICYLLNNFFHCSSYENIVFCWVMHKQEIIDSILNRLDLNDCNVHSFSLICDKENLIKRLDRKHV